MCNAFSLHLHKLGSSCESEQFCFLSWKNGARRKRLGMSAASFVGVLSFGTKHGHRLKTDVSFLL